MAGMSPVTTAMFKNTCRLICVVTPTASSEPNRSRACRATQKAAQHQQRENQHHDARADQPQLLAHHREDEVVVLLREEQELLTALPSPTPSRPPEPMEIRLWHI